MDEKKMIALLFAAAAELIIGFIMIGITAYRGEYGKSVPKLFIGSLITFILMIVLFGSSTSDILGFITLISGIAFVGSFGYMLSKALWSSSNTVFRIIILAFIPIDLLIYYLV